MQITKLARRYAQGIHSWTEESGHTSQVTDEMKQIASVLKNSPELGKFLSNPVMPSSKKTAVIQQIFQSLSPATQRILQLIVGQKREAQLGDIAMGFVQHVEDIQGIQRVELTTATALTSDLKSKILSSTSLVKDPSKLEVIETIDPTILGGYILRVGDQQVDASVRSKLNAIKKEFQQN